MGQADRLEVTNLLQQASAGSREASDLLLAALYSELRKLAKARMAREKPELTLNPTGLVHEAYIRLIGDPGASWENRRHFFMAAAETMRRILVERARKYARIRHGGRLRRTDLDELVAVPTTDVEEFLDLDRALTRLEEFDEKLSAVVKLRYFSGLSIEETAETLGLSVRSVNRFWKSAKIWLKRELSEGA